MIEWTVVEQVRKRVVEVGRCVDHFVPDMRTELPCGHRELVGKLVCKVCLLDCQRSAEQ
ncbi:hypothetical protein D3C87_1984600 [compost metagenome]